MKDCYLISIEGDVRGENDVWVLGQASQVGVVTESLLETTTSLTATETLAANVWTNNEISGFRLFHVSFPETKTTKYNKECAELTLVGREGGLGHKESFLEGAPQNSEL